MAKNKKIVLFIVEGITDEISLGLVLSKIIEKDKIVKFKIINGDITTKYGVNQANILNKITAKIKEFINTNVYKKNDILNIIHLVDTDGAYINDSLILYKNIESVKYDLKCIYTRNVEDIKKRNEQKSQILDRLIQTDKVYKDLPYNIYFFSSNLEHVLQNKQNALDKYKSENANIFEDKFIDEPYNFIKFMNNIQFAVTGDYMETWDFIKRDVNSLNRYSNFHLYLNNRE